jgi:hypothetical protein
MDEYWDNYREYSREKRANNLKKAPPLLEANNMYYIKYSPYHFLVCGQFNFWPSTGKWIACNGTKSGRGILNLIKYIKGDDYKLKRPK